MKAYPRPLFVVALTDTPCLGAAIERACLSNHEAAWEVITVPYESFVHFSSPISTDADLVLIELLRTYDAGRRAEGVPLAQRLAARGLRTAIISPLSIAPAAASPYYWDAGSRLALCHFIPHLLEIPVARPADYLPLESFFGKLLAIPRQHKNHFGLRGAASDEYP